MDCPITGMKLAFKSAVSVSVKLTDGMWVVDILPVEASGAAPLPKRKSDAKKAKDKLKRKERRKKAAQAKAATGMSNLSLRDPSAATEPNADVTDEGTVLEREAVESKGPQKKRKRKEGGSKKPSKNSRNEASEGQKVSLKFLLSE